MDSDDDVYSDDMGMDSDNDYDEAADDSGEHLVNSQQKNYTVLKEGDIRHCQEDDILRVSDFLSVSRDSACKLLRSYNWSVDNVQEAWFADEDVVRNAVGFLKKPIVRFPNATQLQCGICFDIFPLHMIENSSCGHPYCTSCWKTYISISINDGPGCLMLRCPDPSCDAAVIQDMIDKLASDEEKEKYHRYILRSYIESNRKTKWCPAAGCVCAVKYDDVIGSGSYDVSCLCSYSFCWNCTEEVHRPVDCGTVAKWILKNSAESENVNWILANSKPCPKCNRPIEKNQGCMHMTCRPPCNFQFCWLCLGAWKDHTNYYACNRYEIAIQNGELNAAERRREMAQKSLQRYTHYFERWASNHKSRQKALEKLVEKQAESVNGLQFVLEAWQQIVECRRVLKWTYAYGYYIPDHEEAKRQFFEYLQGEAEAGLERLHQCVEKELENYLEEHSDNFINFRVKLFDLTRVTKQFFENLVKALENGLSDVSSSDEAVGSESSSEKSVGSESRDPDDSGYWACLKCTYLNSETTTTCEICN